MSNPVEKLSPKISVLIPSYNQGGFIEETIKSIIEQDYGNWEIVVMDGGSTDGTIEVIERYSSLIAHWESAPDGGQSAALNKAIEKATGDLIAWQNSDDYYLPGAFAACAEAASKNPDVDIFHGTTYRMSQGTREILDQIALPDAGDPYARFPQLCICNASMVIRRRLFDLGLKWNESRHYAMDVELVKDLISRRAKFLFVDGLKAIYRLHEEGKAVVAGARSHLELLNIAREILGDEDLRALWPNARSSAKRELLALYRNLQMRLFTDEYLGCLRMSPLHFANGPLMVRLLKAVMLNARGRDKRGTT